MIRRTLLWLLSFFPAAPEPPKVVHEFKFPAGATPEMWFTLSQSAPEPSNEMKAGLVRILHSDDWQWMQKYIQYKMGIHIRNIFGLEGLENDLFVKVNRIQAGTFAGITEDFHRYWKDLQKNEGKSAEEKAAEAAMKPTFDPLA